MKKYPGGDFGVQQPKKLAFTLQLHGCCAQCCFWRQAKCFTLPPGLPTSHLCHTHLSTQVAWEAQRRQAGMNTPCGTIHLFFHSFNQHWVNLYYVLSFVLKVWEDSGGYTPEPYAIHIYFEAGQQANENQTVSKRLANVQKKRRDTIGVHMCACIKFDIYTYMHIFLWVDYIKFKNSVH